MRREKLVEELSTECHAIFTQHIAGLRRLMDTLPPRLSGLSPQEIHRTLKTELQRSFDECLAWLKERTGATVHVETDLDKVNIVPFGKAVAG